MARYARGTRWREAANKGLNVGTKTTYRIVVGGELSERYATA